MDLFDEFAVDVARLQDGVWRVIEKTSDYPVAESEIGDRVAVLVAGTDSPAFTRALEKRMRPMLMRGRQSDIDAETREKIWAECVAEHVILDWRNWTVKGVKWDYSKALVMQIFTDPQWVNLKQRLSNMIGDTDVFKIVQEDLIAKNS